MKNIRATHVSLAQWYGPVIWTAGCDSAVTAWLLWRYTGGAEQGWIRSGSDIGNKDGITNVELVDRKSDVYGNDTVLTIRSGAVIWRTIAIIAGVVVTIGTRGKRRELGLNRGN